MCHRKNTSLRIVYTHCPLTCADPSPELIRFVFVIKRTDGTRASRLILYAPVPRALDTLLAIRLRTPTVQKKSKWKEKQRTAGRQGALADCGQVGGIHITRQHAGLLHFFLLPSEKREHVPLRRSTSTGWQGREDDA